MSKSESTLFSMVLTMLVITVIAGAAMGFVYEITKEPIAASKLQKKLEAIQEVLPEFNNNPADEEYEMKSNRGFTLTVFPAKKDGELIGVAIQTMSNLGFSGDIKIMVGMTPDGTIVNYKVLEHKETPGLGTKMDDWFKTDKGNRSVIGKNPGKNKLTVKNDGGEVDAITAATITSRAFLDAIEIAYSTYTQKTDATSSATSQTDGTTSATNQNDGKEANDE